ncbi:HPr kinase [Sulfitobacter guttiformis KCTC 32187]|nr:HPr kinase [Sulfitobacter guttiformis KCTC 32187]
MALQLIANGANLVADDRTVVVVHNGRLQASVPNAIAGLIEARGVGLLSLQYVEAVELALVVEMGSIETARLPQPHTATFLAIELPCLHKVDAPYFPAAIYAYLSAIRIEAL